MTELRVADNWLTRLPNNLGAIPHLQTLHLENNRIDRLPPTMGDLRHLTTLDLTRCALTTLAIVPAPHHAEVRGGPPRTAAPLRAASGAHYPAQPIVR